LSLCSDIQAKNPLTPVVMIIPQHDTKLIDMALAGGADDCISYPVHPVLLAKRLHLLLQTPMARFTGQHQIQPYLHEGMFVCAPDGQFLSVNDAFLTLLDYPHSDLMKLSYVDVVPPS